MCRVEKSPIRFGESMEYQGESFGESMEYQGESMEYQGERKYSVIFVKRKMTAILFSFYGWFILDVLPVFAAITIYSMV